MEDLPTFSNIFFSKESQSKYDHDTHGTLAKALPKLVCNTEYLHLLEWKWINTNL